MMIKHNTETYFNITLKHVANFNFPPWLNIDADGKFGQKIQWIWPAKQFCGIGFKLTDKCQIFISSDAKDSKALT